MTPTTGTDRPGMPLPPQSSPMYFLALLLPPSKSARGPIMVIVAGIDGKLSTMAWTISLEKFGQVPMAVITTRSLESFRLARPSRASLVRKAAYFPWPNVVIDFSGTSSPYPVNPVASPLASNTGLSAAGSKLMRPFGPAAEVSSSFKPARSAAVTPDRLTTRSVSRPSSRPASEA